MKPYSNDLRTKIVEAYHRGEGPMRELAEQFSVSLSCVWLLLKRYGETGKVDPKAHGGGPQARIQGEGSQVLRQLVRENPDATLMELRDLFRRRTGIAVSCSTVALSLKKLKITRKKKSWHATQRDKAANVKARAEFIENLPNLPADKLVFVDETSVNLGMTRTYARAPRGHRAEGDKPYHPDTMSLIGAMNLNGVTAALLVEGAVEGATFKVFIEQLWVPTLQPGDIVVLDHLRVHKVDGIEQAIESTGAAVEYLPPYSPDLSPIESAWSKAKELLRSIAARTADALRAGVKKALEAVTQLDVRGWFDHCGYCI
jgi:transposase